MSRRFTHALAFVLSMLAVLAVAVAVQSFAEVLNRRFDMTAEKRLSLSPHAISVLASVEHPLRIELFHRRNERDRPLELLELMRDHCAELSFELVDLDRNPARAKDHGVTHYDRAVVLYQGRETVVPAADEEALVGGIARVLHEKPRVVYFVTGHRERGIAPGVDDAYGRAVQNLRTDGYDVRTLSLVHDAAVPEDASVVVLGGPEVDLVEVEIEKLEAYLARGGAVLVLVDPVDVPQIVAWLAKHGILLRDDVVIDHSNRVYGSDGTNVVVPFYRENEATRSLDVPSVFGRARSVSLPSGGDDDQASGASIVARTAKESFAAAGAARTKSGEVAFDAERDRQGPIGVVAVAQVGKDPAQVGRLAVIGDADFPSDVFLPLLGNKDLFLGTVGWLAAERSSGARAPEAVTGLGPVSPVYVTDAQGRVIFAAAVVAEPLVFLVIGVAVVLARRRRR